MNENQVYTTRTATIWLGDDGIVRKVFLPQAEETLKDALESEKIIKDLCNDRKRPLMVDFSPVRSMDQDARAHYSKSSEHVLAVGGITKSMMSRVIGNFFMGFNRNQATTPGKLFSNEEGAVEWLKTFLN